MKFNKFYTVVIVIILIQLYSCKYIYNDTRNFYLFKMPITLSHNSIPLKTNGIYISDEGGAALFLYENGLVKILRPFFNHKAKEIWLDPSYVISNMSFDWHFYSKEWWGDFLIDKNEIILQDFNRNNILKNRYLFEQRGRILNDTTIVIFSDYVYNTGDSLLKSECLLKFYPTSIKPDSTNIWFVNKKWYRKNLHESRK